MTGLKLTVATAVAMGALIGGSFCVLAAGEYDPRIDPSDFTTNITNPYFSLPVGKKLVFESKTKGGVERTEIVITGEKRKVMGVETLVYWDRVWENGTLVEDTKDYLAQDKEGNVWYFGEDVNNYSGGKLVNHSGSWLAGVKGAKPGIWFKGNPRVGDKYRQEYYAGKAEDMAEVVGVNETVTTASGTYKNCVKTYDWTPLEPNAKEHKYYCQEVGGTALIVDLQSGRRTELVNVNIKAAGRAKALSGTKAGVGVRKGGESASRDGHDDREGDDDRDSPDNGQDKDDRD